MDERELDTVVDVLLHPAEDESGEPFDVRSTHGVV